MPLYEYQCGQCGRFEIIQKFSDSPLATCPRCGGEVQKLLSAPAIQFKGTGWYVTDYARKSSGGDGKSKDGNGSGKKEGGAGTESGSSGSSGTTKEPSSSSAGGTTK